MKGWLLAIVWVSSFTLINWARDNSEPIKAQLFLIEGQDLLMDNTAQLEKKGLIFTNNDPDVILCNHVSNKILDLKKPIIILEKRASAYLTENTIKALKKYPNNIKAVFKNHILRPKNLFNNKALCHCLHFVEINKFAKIAPPSKLTQQYFSPKELNKIKNITWYYNSAFSKRFNKTRFPMMEKEEIDTEKKTIDLFFAGSISFDYSANSLQRLMKAGRAKAIEKMNNIEGIHKEIYIGRNALDYDEYIEKMKQAKIVVSPWGTGEWCFRDIEAMHSYAIVVKPNSNHIETFPDIFQENVSYIPCKADFSDLEKIVKNILTHYEDYKEIAINAKKIIDNVNLDTMLERFVNAIKDILNEK